jgi:hypothetical protein
MRYVFRACDASSAFWSSCLPEEIVAKLRQVEARVIDLDGVYDPADRTIGCCSA